MILTLSIAHESLSPGQLFDALNNLLPVLVQLIQLLLIFV